MWWFLKEYTFPRQLVAPTEIHAFSNSLVSLVSKREQSHCNRIHLGHITELQHLNNLTDFLSSLANFNVYIYVTLLLTAESSKPVYSGQANFSVGAPERKLHHRALVPKTRWYDNFVVE